MRDFTWNYFSKTGDVNAYLFYKEMADNGNAEQPMEEEPEAEGAEIVF